MSLRDDLFIPTEEGWGRTTSVRVERELGQWHERIWSNWLAHLSSYYPLYSNSPLGKNKTGVEALALFKNLLNGELSLGGYRRIIPIIKKIKWLPLLLPQDWAHFPLFIISRHYNSIQRNTTWNNQETKGWSKDGISSSDSSIKWRRRPMEPLKFNSKSIALNLRS